MPPELGEEHAPQRIRERVGEDGYELDVRRDGGGQPFAIDTPLMEHISAFVEREDPAPR